MTATLTRRQPGQLAPPPVPPCTCAPGFTHPDRRHCPRHYADHAVTHAVRLVRSGDPRSALRLLERTAQRTPPDRRWWRP